MIVLKEAYQIWYRGSNRDTPLKMVTDGTGNDTDQFGPGIYFTDDPELAEAYGKLHTYKINMVNFKTEKHSASVSPVWLSLFIKQAPDYEYHLVNYGENVNVAMREAVKTLVDYAENFPDLLQTLAADFFRQEPVKFIETASAKGINGIIMKDGDRKILVLYNLSMAKEVR